MREDIPEDSFTQDFKRHPVDTRISCVGNRVKGVVGDWLFIQTIQFIIHCWVFKELQDRETQHRNKHNLWFDAPPLSTDSKKLIHERTNALKHREMQYQLGSMDRAGNLSTFMGTLKVDWIDFPLDDILQQFTTLKEGSIREVFKQKAASAWFGCRAEKAQITVLFFSPSRTSGEALSVI